MESSLVSFSLWCRCIGLTPFERRSAERQVFGSPASNHHDQDFNNNGVAAGTARGERRLHHAESSEELVPAAHHPSRNETLSHSTNHLVASLIGGGVFGLPHVYARCGLLGASALLLILTAVTERSLFLTCLTARRAGVRTYLHMVKVAFGKGAERAVCVWLLLFLLSVLVGYFLLLADLWMALAHRIVPLPSSVFSHMPEQEQELLFSMLLLLTNLVLVSPFFVIREFRCFRIKCYATLLAICALLLVLGINSKHTIAQLSLSVLSSTSSTTGQRATLEMEPDASEDTDIVDILYTPESFQDLLFAVPIVVMSLMTTNTLNIQANLIDPTKARMTTVIRLGVSLSTFLTLAFGMIGYLYAGNDTDGNFLLTLSRAHSNFNKDGVFLCILLVLGRLGCTVLILFATAMNVPHCRAMLLQVVDFVFIQQLDDDQCRRVKETFPDECCDQEASLDDQTCMSFPSLSSRGSDKSTYVCLVAPNEESRLLPRIAEENVPPECDIYSNRFAHYAGTFGIVSFCFAITVLLTVTGTPFLAVWSLSGSLFALPLAYTIPAACFIQIQTRQPLYPGSSTWIVFCWTLITMSSLATLLCTIYFIYASLSSPMTAIF